MPTTPPGSVIDGVGVGYGSALLTFSTSGAYIAENITINRPVQIATDRKTDGEPNRQRITADFITGSATLQAPAGTAGWPVFGEYFTLTTDDNYGAEIFFLMPPEVQYTNDATALRKIPITFRRKNTTTLTSVAALGAQP